MRATDSPSRTVTVAWTLAGLGATAWYFGWLLEPGRADTMVLFCALIAADLFNGLHAASFWLTCLRAGRRRVRGEVPAGVRVDVLVPTLDEPADVLAATVRAALRMRGAARLRVWLLDDGDRPEVAELARLLGAHYLSRRRGRGAKAGNLNNALRLTAEGGGGAEYVCVFDADHVPMRSFLERTLPLFADPRVALVQTPQVYGNIGAGPLTAAAAEQQAIFFGPICRGRDGWGASFCCGTNFVARRDALASVGGFPEDSVTEDIVMSIALNRAGWDIAYEPTVLAVGLGPEDARSYLKQQERWAKGCLGLLLRRPLALRGLRPARLWLYVVATSWWLTGWTILVYLALPVARLVLGARVVVDPRGEFAVHFLPYFVLAVVNLGRLTNGAYTLRGIALNWGIFAVQVRATAKVALGRTSGFAVTSKRALLGVPWGALAPNLLGIGALAGACAYGLARGITPGVVGTTCFAVIGVLLLAPIVVFAAVQ
ncbi:MAG TPA: cellulose synthase catalytic subunit, partial [Solirubrobacteraceae bacterium]|nr:cellulose synthase catalytic subunit [Solirubrobacteraceae bacterium]